MYYSIRNSDIYYEKLFKSNNECILITEKKMIIDV